MIKETQDNVDRVTEVVYGIDGLSIPQTAAPDVVALRLKRVFDDVDFDSVDMQGLKESLYVAVFRHRGGTTIRSRIYDAVYDFMFGYGLDAVP